MITKCFEVFFYLCSIEFGSKKNRFIEGLSWKLRIEIVIQPIQFKTPNEEKQQCLGCSLIEKWNISLNSNK